MSKFLSSPLSALATYYDRLARDSSQTVAEFGYSSEKIHFAVVLERNGELASLEDLREPGERGKPKPRLMIVPHGGGRAGSALKPFFCWDNTGYALGRDNKDKPARAKEMFAAFQELHLSMKDEVGDDAGYNALCRFLERWRPEQAPSLPHWEEAAGLNVVYKLRGRPEYVHQSDAVKRAWVQRTTGSLGTNAAVRGVSLISGQEEELARLHPLIGGVVDANTMGAAVVSFNLGAFESYGKSQSYNAPVGVRDAFRYTTALNWLLSQDRRRVRIGDSSVVFWSDRVDAADAEEVFSLFFSDEVRREETAESEATLERVRAFFKAALQGQLDRCIKNPEAPFYVLGLSPNISRLNVRFWLAGTVSQFAERLANHLRHLEMTGARPNDPPLGIRRMLLETARDPKDIAPQLAGELTRSLLAGSPYPQALFIAVVRRIRADATVNHRRAAILKAYLVRNLNQEVPMALNKDHPDEAYQFGRLFAALEKTQEDATDGKLNATIRDRYFASAGARPAIVFPQLLQLHQHHLDKIGNRGHRINREKLIGEIFSHFGRFPSHLSLEKQGLFYVAYYHQRQDFFTSKSESFPETNQ